MNDRGNGGGSNRCEDSFFGNEPVGKVGADEKMMMPIHGPFIDQGFMLVPGAADFRVHNDFRVREKDIEVEGAILIFVTQITTFVVSFREGGVYRFEIDEGFVDGTDKILRRIKMFVEVVKGGHRI